MQVITGSAEYGATVRISGGKEEVEVTADDFTALWRAEVTLNSNQPEAVTNTLSVTATDSSGNTSDPTVVEIIVGPPPGVTTSFTFTLTGDAADGQIEAGQEITYTYETLDAYGDPTDQPVLVTLNAASAVVLDDGFSGEGTIFGVTHASEPGVPYRLSAVVINGAVDKHVESITVVPASGQRLLDLTLSHSNVAVSSPVLLLTIVTDIFGNRIDTPLPTFEIFRVGDTTPLTLGVDYTLSATGELVFSTPGLFRVVATFDDGTNAIASDFEYIVVEPEPDVTPPLITIDNVNGFQVCLDGRLSIDCGSPDEPIFRQGATIGFDVSVTDDMALASVSYTAFGAGVSAGDTVLIAANQTSANLGFAFDVRRGWAGEVQLVVQAVDAAGNVAASAAVIIRVGLDIAAGGRDVLTLTSSAALTDAWGIAVDSTGGIAVTNHSNNNNNNAFLFSLGQGTQNLGILADFNFLNERLDFVTFDTSGNAYVSINNDDTVWQVNGATGALALYVPPQGDPDGLASLGAIPARGRWEVGGTLQDGDCLTIETASDSLTQTAFVYAMAMDTQSDGCGGASCTFDSCVSLSTSQAAQMTEVADWLNVGTFAPAGGGPDMQVRALTELSAFESDRCAGSGNNNGSPCVFLVADVPGSTPQSGNNQPIALTSNNGNWTPVDVDSGRDADVLYVVDNNNDVVREYAVPSDPLAGSTGTFDFGNVAVNGQLRGIAAALRVADGDAPGLGSRLFLFVTNDRNVGFDWQQPNNPNNPDEPQILVYDSGRDHYGVVLDGRVDFLHDPSNGSTVQDYLNSPFGVTYVPLDSSGGGNCLLVANREPSGWFGPRGEILAVTKLDGGTGAAPSVNSPMGEVEGGAPIATGFSRIRGLALDASDADPANWRLLVVDEGAQAVVSIGRSTDAADCF